MTERGCGGQGSPIPPLAPRPLVRWTVLASLALVLAALAAETLVRVAARLDPEVRFLARPGGPSDPVPQTVAELVESRPDALAPHGVHFGHRRNRFGFNDREFEDDVRPGAVRVVALGDSFTFGLVPYPRAHITTAEAVANLVTGGRPPVTIHNLGVSASGIADHRLVFRIFGRRLRPHLALVTLYLGNDLLDFGGWRPARDAGGPFDSWWVTFVRRSRTAGRDLVRPPDLPGEGSATARGGERVRGRLDLSDDGPTFGRPRHSEDAWSRVVSAELDTFLVDESAERRTSAFFDELEELRRDLAAAGVDMALVLAPTRLQVEEAELRWALEARGLGPDDVDVDRPRERIVAWAGARGVPLLDLTPVFRERSAEGQRLYVPRDTHWNVSGNDVAGMAVGTWLGSADGIASVAPGRGEEEPGRAAAGVSGEQRASSSAGRP